MSDQKMFAYVAIRRFGKRGGGAQFAYLPNNTILLPAGWEWNMLNGAHDMDDVSGVAESMRLTDLDEVCRFMSQGSGIEWEVNHG